MHIIIDTTETYKDLTLSGPLWNVLEEFLSKGPHHLVVPEIVVQETMNHYKERVRDTLAQYNECVATLKALFLDQTFSPPVNPDLAQAKFERLLNDRLRDLNANVLDYSEVELGRLVRRSLGRKKPFDEKGHKGFRDAILWECIKSLRVDPDERIMFITGNHKDFADEKALHPHLSEEVYFGSQVIIVNNLKCFIEEYAKPELEHLASILKELQDGTFKDFSVFTYLKDLKDEIRTKLDEFLTQCKIFALKTTGESLQKKVQELKELEDIVIADAVRLAADGIFIDGTFKIEGVIGATEIGGQQSPNLAYPDDNFCPVTFEIDFSIQILEGDEREVAYDISGIAMNLHTSRLSRRDQVIYPLLIDGN